MAGARLTTRDSTPPSGWNEARQTFFNNSLEHSLNIQSSATTTLRTVVGIRFPSTPLDLADNIRQLALNLSCLQTNTSFDDLHFVMKGHKVANSGPFISGNIPSLPRTRWESADVTTASWEYHKDDVGLLPFTLPDEGAIQEIVEEIMSVPGWVPGNPITLLLCGFNDREKICRLEAGAGANWENNQPNIFLSYGEFGDDPIVMELLIGGDSWGAYMGQSGFTKSTVTYPLFPNYTFLNVPAGAAAKVGSADIYNGDNIRGYVANGIIQDEFENRYGDENIIITRHEHAFAGSRTAEWLGGIDDGRFWGDIDTPGSLRYNLANPRSYTGLQLFWLSLGGNDIIQFGKANRIFFEEDTEAGDELWQDYVDNEVESWIRACIDEAFRCAADPEKLWIVIPGYANFNVISRNWDAINPIVFANSMAQDAFRQVWSIDGYAMAGRQYYYDCLDNKLNGGNAHGDGSLSLQSTLTQFAAHRQQHSYPGDIPPGAEYNPNADSFTWALYNVNYPFPQGPLAWTAWNYNSQSGWKHGMRNITDITINRRMKLLDAVYRRIEADYPHVVYTPSWENMPTDTVLSADPTSEYAQSPSMYWVEGIHLNEAGSRLWLTSPNGPLDQAAARVSFFPEYEEPPPGEPGTPVTPVPPTPHNEPTSTSFWKMAVGDGADERRLVQPLDRDFDFRLKEPSSLSFKFNLEDEDATYIQELQTDVKLYHRGTKVGRFRVGPSDDSFDENTGYVTFAAIDYRGMLERRYIQDDDQSYWYGEDVTVPVWDMVTFTQGRVNGNLGISKGLGFPTLGVVREEIEAAPGDDIFGSIQKMAENKELGFEWDIDFNLEMNLWTQRGVGALTPKNLEYRGTIIRGSRSFNTDEFANAARVSGGDTVLPEQLESTDLLTDTRGRWEAQLSWPDSETQELMNDRAQYLLEQVNKVPEVFSITLRQGWWEGPTHIWLGDTCWLSIKLGRLNVYKSVRVQRIHVTPDEHGGENVEMELK